jgi:hypothetical protein
MEPLEDRRMMAVFTVDAGGGGTHTTIQAAIDAASAASDGNDEIIIKAGTYAESLTIASSANLENLRMHGETGVASAVVINPGAGNVGMTISDESVTIESLTVTGGLDGIRADSVSGLKLLNLTVTNHTDRGVELTNSRGLTTISGGTYSDNDAAIVALATQSQGGGQAEPSLVVNEFNGTEITVTNNVRTGLRAEHFRGGVSITKGSFTANDTAGTLDNGGIWLANLGTGTGVGTVTITGATVTGNSQGLMVDGAKGVTLTDGTYSNNTEAGVTLDDVAGAILLDGILVSTNTKSGVVVSGTGNGDVTIVDMTASTNGTATGGAGLGAGVAIASRTGNITVTNSTFANNADDGLRLTSITGNVQLVLVTADDNNQDNDTDGEGFNAEGDVAISGSLTISGSRFRDSGAGATQRQRMGVLISRVGGAILVQNSGAQQTEVTGNEVGGFQITKGDSTATFTNGNYSNNTGQGLNVTLAPVTGDAVFTGVTATNNTDHGIAVQNSQSVTFTNVTATMNNNAGAVARVVAGNVIDTDGNYTNNGNDGLLMGDVGGDLTLIRTIADNNDRNNNNEGDGIRVAKVSATVALGGKLTVQGVRARDLLGASDHQQFGLFVESMGTGNILFVSDSNGGTITHNSFTGNEEGGAIVAAGGGTVTVTNGDYSGNTGFGLSISTPGGATATFTDVTASNNTEAGIRLDNPGNAMMSVTFTNVIASGNGRDGLRMSGLPGSLILDRVTADNNDSNNDGQGDGIRITNGAGGFSIGGSLFVHGVKARDLQGANDHQENGLSIQTIADTQNVQLGSSTSPANEFIGNEGTGVLIQNGGKDVAVVGGSFSANGGDGLVLNGFQGVITFDDLTINSNVGDGFEIAATVTTVFDLSNFLDYFGSLSGNVGGGGRITGLTTLNFSPTTGTDFADDTIVIGTSAFQYRREGTIYDIIRTGNIGTMNVNLKDGNNVVEMAGAAATTTYNINTGIGNDWFVLSSDADLNVYDPTGNLDAIDGIVNLNAGAAGFDVLRLGDRSGTAAQSGTLTRDKVTGLGMQIGVNYQNFDWFSLLLSEGADSLAVDNIDIFSVIELGSGNDTVTVNAARTSNASDAPRSAIAAPMQVRGGAGTDSLIVNYSDPSGNLPSGSDSVLVTDAAVFSGFTIVLHDALEALRANTLGGDDIVYVNHLNDRMPAQVIVDGGSSGNDKLWINGTSDNDIITITDLGSTGRYQVTNLEYIKAFGYNGNDVIRNLSSVGSLIEGGIGDDFLEGGAVVDVIYGSLGQDSISGNGGNDFLFLDFDLAGNNYNDAQEAMDGGNGTDVGIGLNFDTTNAIETLLTVNNAAQIQALLNRARSQPVSF